MYVNVGQPGLHDTIPGSTVHHHGQSPSRGGVPPLAIPHTNSMSATQRTSMSLPGTPTPGQRRTSTSPVSTGFLQTSTPLHGQPPVKRIKLEEDEIKDPLKLRQLVYEHKHKELLRMKELYNEHMIELFYLQTGGNMMDYVAMKKKPTPQLLTFLKTNKLDSDDEEEVIKKEVKLTSGGTAVAMSTSLPPEVTQLVQKSHQSIVL